MKMNELEQYKVKKPSQIQNVNPHGLSFDINQYRVNQEQPGQIEQQMRGAAQDVPMQTEQPMPYVGQKGFPGVWEDIKESAYNAIPEAIGSIPGLLKGAYEGGQQFGNSDTRMRAMMNVAAGIPELGKQIYNVAPRSLNYLSEKEILPKDYNNLLPTIGETGLKRKLFGEPQPGDEFLEGLAPFILAKKPLSAGRKTALPTLAAISGIQGGNPFAGAALGEIFNQAGGLTKAGVKQFEQYNQVKGARKEAPFKEARANQAESNLNESQRMQQEAEQAQNEAFNQEQSAKNALGNKIEETGGESATLLNKRIMKNSEKLKGLNQEQAAIPSTQRLEEYERVYNDSQNQLQETENALNHQFGQGRTHNEHIAKALFEAQDKIEKEISGEYKGIHESLKGVKVPIKSSHEIAKLESQLKKAIPGIGDAALEKAVQKAAEQFGIDIKDKYISADEFLSNWKTIRDQGYTLRRQSIEATEEGPRRQFYESSVKALKAADILKNKMKEIFPPDIYDRLMNTNERFKKEVAPVRNNRTWYEIKRNKKIRSKDLIEKLGGEGPGAPILRSHILNNPAIADLMVGSRLAGKNNKWAEIDEATLPYLQASSPKTRQLLSDYSSARSNLAESEAGINQLAPQRAAQNKLTEQANELIKSLDKDKKILAELEKKRMQLNEKERQTSKAKEKVSDIKEGRKFLEENKKSALKDKMENEKKIEEYEKKIEKAKSKLVKMLAYVGGASIGVKVLRSLF